MEHSKMFFVLDDETWLKGINVPSDLSPIYIQTTRFPNGEVYIHFPEHVTDRDVVLLKRFSEHIHADIFELFQCVDTLNRMGAKTITLLLPYYPYARQDHNTNYESQNALLLAKTLSQLGVSKIVTIDVHAPEQLRKFPIEVIPLTTEHFWAKHLNSLIRSNNTIQIVAADKSAALHAQHIAEELHCSWGYVNKRREKDGTIRITEVSDLHPEKQIFLMDDLIDTGRTMIAAAQSLQQRTTRSIIACATHCNLSNDLLSKLKTCGIYQLITTNTLRENSTKLPPSENVTSIDIFPLLYENSLLGFSKGTFCKKFP